MLQTIRQLTWQGGLFSLKAFAGAMLALYIAFRLDLSQPMWAVTTVYIVSQPYAGMVLAKAAYRVLGTVIGALASLAFVALFSNTPELFCLALALWIGLGTAVTIYLRDAPHAYAGMLSGYSAAIIGLPAALAPGTAFDFAIARCLEITLGIACGALVHHLVLPRRAGDALRKALDATLPAMARWAGDALRGLEEEARGLADRRRIVGDVVALDALRGFAAIDTPAIRAVDPVVRHFEGKLLSLLALLLSIHDRLGLLRRERPSAAAGLQPVAERVAAHIAGPDEAAADARAGRERDIKREIAAALPGPAALRADPGRFQERMILLRMGDVLDLWHEAVRLRAQIAAGARPRDAGAAPSFRQYRDPTLALVGGFVSAVAVLVASAFWIATAWPNGPTAVTFAGIICALMGARDDPVAASVSWLRLSMVAAVLAAIGAYLILPALTGFPMLVAALAPFYLICGLLLTAPRAAPFVMPQIFIGGALMGVSNTMTYDFAGFLNSFSGYFVGITIAAVLLGLLRPLGAGWTVGRLTRGVMADLARLAGRGPMETRAAFESRMFDRINVLLARLDPMDAGQRAAMQGGLASLRVGLNILLLRRMRFGLAPADRPLADAALSGLAAHFDRAARDRIVDDRAGGAEPLAAVEAARDRLGERLDAGEEDAPGDGGEAARLMRALEAIHGIDTTLRQHAGFFRLPASSGAADELVLPRPRPL